MKNEQRTERIVAHLLGELSELDRMQFEKELAGDEALRAEHQRLAATIGLVKGTLSEESLSPASQAKVLDAARAQTPVAPAAPVRSMAWYRSPQLRAAAAVVALFGVGVFATQTWMQRDGAVSLESARVEQADADFARADADQSVVGKKDSKESARRVPGVEALSESEEGGETRQRVAGTLQDAREAEPNAADEALPERSKSLGYADVAADPKPASPSVAATTPPNSPPVPAEESGLALAKNVRSNDAPMNAASAEPAGSEMRIGIGGSAGAGKFAKRHGFNLGTGGSVGGLGSSGERHSYGGASAAPNQAAKGRVTGEDAWSLGHGQRLQGDELARRELDAVAADDTEAKLEKAQELYVQGRLSASDLNDIVAGGERTDRALSPELRERLRELGYESSEADRADRLIASCYRRPNESPSAMFFRFWGDNPFELPALDALSTFAVDVDTASYTLARRYLAEGRVPEKAQVRTEEFVNYFDSGVPAPSEDSFGVALDLAPSRFGGTDSQRWMLRVALKGKDVADFERDPVALTFVVDTSGSMKTDNRLELVKTSLRLLCTQLDANDAIAIVAFSSQARLVLPMTSAANRDTIEMALSQLQPTGSTNAEAGLMLGYAHASDSLTTGASNRVIFLSDGVANVGQTDQDRINTQVTGFRDRGIYLNTVGVGFGNHNDTFLEQLADKGDGICDYVDTALEARKAFVENFTGKLQTIARDVKIQVEFDPRFVERYRLLGYENRAVADKDFRNDAVDAGEIGAGHEVTALYELELAGVGDVENPLATVRVRWKAPHGKAPEGRDPELAFELAQTLAPENVSTSFESTSAGYRKAVVVAQFAELLRRSIHASGDSLDDLIGEAGRIAALDDDREFDEFVALLGRSRELIVAKLPRHDELRLAVDAFRRNQYLCAQLEDLAAERNTEILEDLEARNRELEAKIRELLDSGSTDQENLEILRELGYQD